MGLASTIQTLLQIERKLAVIDENVATLQADVATLQSNVKAIQSDVTALLAKQNAAIDAEDLTAIKALHDDLNAANMALAFTIGQAPATPPA